MKSVKNAFLLLLAALLTASSMAACGDTATAETNAGDTTAADTVPAETEPEKLLPDLPDADYEGYTLPSSPEGSTTPTGAARTPMQKNCPGNPSTTPYTTGT